MWPSSDRQCWAPRPRNYFRPPLPASRSTARCASWPCRTSSPLQHSAIKPAALLGARRSLRFAAPLDDPIRPLDIPEYWGVRHFPLVKPADVLTLSTGGPAISRPGCPASSPTLGTERLYRRSLGTGPRDRAGAFCHCVPSLCAARRAPPRVACVLAARNAGDLGRLRGVGAGRASNAVRRVLPQR